MAKDLEELGRIAATSGLAAMALALARGLDHPGNSLTSKAMAAGKLLDTLNRLRELAPPEERKDQLDELHAKRAARRAAGE